MTNNLDPQSPDPSSEAEAAQGPGGISPELLADPYGEEILDISAADFEALLSDHADVMGDFKEGEIVHAKVLRVTDSMVILEFGFKSEGTIPLDEFKDRDGIEPGQEVEVLLESLEDDDGIVVLSKKKADFLRVWEKIREAHEADEPVEGMLARKIKGGVTVDIMGVDAFLPGSQIALRRVPNIDDLLGQTFEFKIIKLNKRRRNIVVSRRVILEGERERKRETLVKELLVGQVREGIVKNITDFGAFIDLGGLDGLLHITDMSWGRVGHPSEVVDIGANLDIKVLDIDWDRERISLGLKQLLPYPWTDIDKKYPVGSRVRGKVVSITNYGAFIELEKGVEGLVHISEMSWTRNIRHPSKLVNIGDEIEAVVLKVDMQDEKISLGMKQIEEDPWLALPAKYPTGTQLAGVVRNLTSFGAFVEIESGIDGLVHVSDLSWTRRVEHPSEVIQKGDEVQVLVLDVDAEAKRISLGIKQLSDDPWPEIVERFSAGVEPAGSVARVQEKGVVVDLGDDIEGFVPTSHSGVEEEEKLPEYYRAGEAVELKVIESDAANRRIVLEVTTLPERMDVPEPPPVEEFDEESGSEGQLEAVGDEPDASAEGVEEPEAVENDEPAAADDEQEADAVQATTEEDSDEDAAEADEEGAAEADAIEATAEKDSDEDAAEADEEGAAEADAIEATAEEDSDEDAAEADEEGAAEADAIEATAEKDSDEDAAEADEEGAAEADAIEATAEEDSDEDAAEADEEGAAEADAIEATAEEDSGEDTAEADEEGAAEADAGEDEADAGEDEADAGEDEADAGEDEADAGEDEADAGEDEADAGEDEADAGEDEADAGEDEADAGEDEADAGEDEADAGGDEADAGEDEADAGEDEADAGEDEADAGGDEADAGDVGEDEADAAEDKAT